MRFNMLIKGGTVVDGTGAKPYKADVRVDAGKIIEIGADLQAAKGERVINAEGCHVTPGFIETHNHWDGAVWWSPNMEPCSAYGITTSVNGNCGFSLAPARPENRPGIIDIFNFFVDIPEIPLESRVPWDWLKWSEYKASFERRVKVPVNFAAFCGHIPMRLYVMGDDAWTRVATSDEIAQMCDLLEDAMAAGAMGLSVNQLDYDKDERPLPSQLADDAEYAALLAVLARYPDATLQLITDHFFRMTGPVQLERFGKLVKDAGVRMHWVAMPVLHYQKPVLGRATELHEQFKAEGLDIWAGYHHVSPTSVINFGRSLVFSQNGNPVWQEVVNARTWEEKAQMLSDPDWLDRARDSWNNQFAHSALNDPTALTLRESESGFGPVAITMAQYMADNGFAHASDAMAEWVLNNGAESIIHKRSLPVDDSVVLQMIRDPRSIGSISDAGAHGKLFCGVGDAVLLLTDYVRDRQLITMEEAIHALTGKIAEFFNMRDRGVIAVGKAADIIVFNLAEIEERPEEKIWDVEDGEGGRTYRYSRAPAPMRLTLVNGVPTFDHGGFAGRFPGQFIGPDQPNSYEKIAAE